jgi:hypothetical protein
VREGASFAEAALRNGPKPKLSGGCRTVCHALIGGEHGFGFAPSEIGDHDLFADVERAQVLLGRVDVDFHHGSLLEREHRIRAAGS